MITYPFASGIMVKHLNPDVSSSLGSVPVCRDCAVDSAALRCVGVSYCQSNCDFAYCPDAMQKTDSEMSEQGDECKPEQPSIPLQLNVNVQTTWEISEPEITVQGSTYSCKESFDHAQKPVPFDESE